MINDNKNETILLILENPAKSAGGDRYKWIEGGSIYIPQYLSRIDGIPVQNLTLKIHDECVENSLEFSVLNLAKKNGGDKYECKTDKKFIVYFPQAISRKTSGNIYISIA